jgi:hypothetical protein
MHNAKHDVSAETLVHQTQSDQMSLFTSREWVTFLQLRRRYQGGRDLWSAHELGRLRFVRWLYTTGQIEP